MSNSVSMTKRSLDGVFLTLCWLPFAWIFIFRHVSCQDNVKVMLEGHLRVMLVCLVRQYYSFSWGLSPNHGILFWFFSLTRLKKKSWPLILSFSPSCRSRKNWEKHYFEAEATPKPQKMFFSVFPTEGTWGKTQNQRSTFFLKKRVREKN